jgi:hypothetical protein
LGAAAFFAGDFFAGVAIGDLVRLGSGAG